MIGFPVEFPVDKIEQTPVDRFTTQSERAWVGYSHDGRRMQTVPRNGGGYRFCYATDTPSHLVPAVPFLSEYGETNHVVKEWPPRLQEPAHHEPKKVVQEPPLVREKYVPPKKSDASRKFTVNDHKNQSPSFTPLYNYGRSRSVPQDNRNHFNSSIGTKPSHKSRTLKNRK